VIRHGVPHPINRAGSQVERPLFYFFLHPCATPTVSSNARYWKSHRPEA
jgi:hypothetical protein